MSCFRSSREGKEFPRSDGTQVKAQAKLTTLRRIVNKTVKLSEVKIIPNIGEVKMGKDGR